jgi:anti-anti-sigma factor
MRLSARASFNVRADADGILWLSGEFDLATVDDFVSVALPGIDPQRETVLDLSGLDFIDASGLHAILRLATASKEGVRLRGAKENVRKLLAITGMDRMSPIRVDELPRDGSRTWPTRPQVGD